MGMGHREKIKTGDEMDCFTRWRHKLGMGVRPGITQWIKKRFSRRVRREERRRLKGIEKIHERVCGEDSE